MDVLFLEIVHLMNEAEAGPIDAGHDKKSCVLHGARKLLKSNQMAIDPAILDGFIDVECLLARNKQLLAPLTKSVRTCFSNCRKKIKTIK